MLLIKNLSDDRPIGPPIQKKDEGRRLDQYLARNYPFFSRYAWKQLCEAGEVKVNRQSRKSDYRLQRSDEITRYFPQDKKVSSLEEPRLRYCEAQVAVIHKPAGWTVHEVGDVYHQTLRAWLHRRLGEDWDFVHRLDTDTSGLMVAGCGAKIRSKLSECWATRSVRKIYCAILHGHPVDRSVTIDDPIDDDLHSPIARKRVSASGKSSLTIIQPVEVRGCFSLVKILIETGRGAQIRVHTASRGFPVLGDQKYGTASSSIDRQALHAESLEFLHPMTNQRICLSEAMPEDMRRAYQAIFSIENVDLASSPHNSFAGFSKLHPSHERPAAIQT